jgi:hypothetical protein
VIRTKSSAIGHEDVLCQLSYDAAVVEIGFYNGWSASQILKTCRHLISIDIGECPNHRAFLDSPKFEFRRGDSRKMTPEACDFLFIDGDHSYEAVMDDLSTWGPCALKHIALHDSARPQAAGVRTAAFQWLSRNHNWVVFADYQHNEGLLVLRRK